MKPFWSRFAGDAAFALRSCVGMFEEFMAEYARLVPATGGGAGLEACACCAAAFALRRASSCAGILAL
jgi:hypothetical protein